ncbi:MAG: hypothetical protein ACR2PW_01850 [Gammaproteobacteria bacterium]
MIAKILIVTLFVIVALQSFTSGQESFESAGKGKGWRSTGEWGGISRVVFV